MSAALVALTSSRGTTEPFGSLDLVLGLSVRIMLMPPDSEARVASRARSQCKAAQPAQRSVSGTACKRSSSIVSPQEAHSP